MRKAVVSIVGAGGGAGVGAEKQTVFYLSTLKKLERRTDEEMSLRGALCPGFRRQGRSPV